ncbi:MAG: hypothetical protein GY931_02820 [Maribacter sp.]|nr:hypothetical protein [Maribacter sp.]
MKKKLGVVFAFIMGVNLNVAQTSCSTYYPFEEGTTFQITSYDKNDKETGVLDYVVKESSGDTATLAYEMHDEKGKLIMASEYGITCENDGISIDFSSLMAPGVLEQYEGMEVDISGTNLLLPNNLSPGQTLPDADVLANIKVPPINMKMTVSMTNRKVEGKESVTTPAGTYDCYVITNDHESKMGVKISGSSKQWLAEGVGMVQQESYNKKGKLIGKSVLTAFNK